MTTAVILAVVGALWMACYVVNYGASLAYFQRGWPTVRSAREDRWFSRLWSIGGPISLLSLLAKGGFKYGFQWHATDSDDWKVYTVYTSVDELERAIRGEEPHG